MIKMMVGDDDNSECVIRIGSQLGGFACICYSFDVTPRTSDT